MRKSRQEFQTAGHIQSQEQREMMRTLTCLCSAGHTTFAVKSKERWCTHSLDSLVHTQLNLSTLTWYRNPCLRMMPVTGDWVFLHHLTQFKTVSHRHVHRLTTWTQSLTETLFPNDPKLYQVNKANHHSSLYQVVPQNNNSLCTYSTIFLWYYY